MPNTAQILADHLGHLIDSASNNHQRFVRAAFKDDLIFPGYEQDGWVALQRYQDSSWPELITLWATFNRHIATVMAAVPAEARDRIHTRHNLDEIASRAPASPEQATLAYFMDDYVVHLELHLRRCSATRGFHRSSSDTPLEA